MFHVLIIDWLIYSRPLEPREPGPAVEYPPLQAAQVEQTHCTEAPKEAGGDQPQAVMHIEAL